MNYYEQVYFDQLAKQISRRSPVGPHGLWYDPHNTRDKLNHPYSYDSFFVFGDHKTIEGSEVCYTDRYSQWDNEKFRTALAAIGRNCRWDQMRVSELQKFVDAFHGPGFKVTGLVESCNQASGYPVWAICFKKSSKRKK